MRNRRCSEYSLPPTAPAYLLDITEPRASKTDLEAKFSEAMSTRLLRWRRFSCSMRSKISGSVSASDWFKVDTGLAAAVAAAERERVARRQMFIVKLADGFNDRR